VLSSPDLSKAYLIPDCFAPTPPEITLEFAAAALYTELTNDRTFVVIETYYGDFMADTAQITVNVYDGARQPLDPSIGWMVRASDGRPLSQRQTQTFAGLHGPGATLTVPFFDMFFDNYTVIVSPDGYSDCAWAPVPVDTSAPAVIDLMALPKNPSANFAAATWAKLVATRPGIAEIIRRGNGGNDAAAQTAWGSVLESRPLALACFLNITMAMSQMILPSGKTPLDYYWNIGWPDGDSTAGGWLAKLDEVFKQDRFFCYVDASILPDIRQAAKQGSFAQEANPSMFHPGSTESYKQTQFDVANVQLTFHGKDVHPLPGPDGNPVPCVKIEPDIDYYKDLLAHGLLEVLPNAITKGLTDPLVVYMLRWVAAKRIPGIAEFDPLFTIQGAASATL
jgi:hypothetical protein